ncbi:MAG: hypothetical protein V1746_01840 [bacterium]
MQKKWISLFIGLSLFLHIFFLLLLPWGLALAHLISWSPKKTPARTIALTLVPKSVETKKAFLDSSGMVKTDKPDPHAQLESEANTIAASRERGAGNASLPSVSGEKAPWLETRESRISPSYRGQMPVPPSPPEQPQLQPAPQPSPIAKQDVKPPEESGLLPTRKDVFEPSLSARPTPRPAPPRDVAARAPPSVFSADRRASQISGGAALGDAASLASQESAMGRYKSKLYRAIGSRWYLYVQNRMSLLSIGQVRVRFYIRANGVIEKTEFVEGDPHTVLADISRRSVLEVGALEPFPLELKQQLGEGYWEEITFNIY